MNKYNISLSTLKRRISDVRFSKKTKQDIRLTQQKTSENNEFKLNKKISADESIVYREIASKENECVENQKKGGFFF